MKRTLKMVLLAAWILPAIATAQESDIEKLIREAGLREDSAPVREHPGWKPPSTVIARLWYPEWLDDLQAAVPGVEIIAVDSTSEGLDCACRNNAVPAQAMTVAMIFFMDD